MLQKNALVSSSLQPSLRYAFIRRYKKRDLKKVVRHGRMGGVGEKRNMYNIDIARRERENTTELFSAFTCDGRDNRLPVTNNLICL